MKIKITANSHIKLPSYIKNIDIDYGFAFYTSPIFDTKTAKDSFSIKLLSKLEKTINKLINFTPLDNDKKAIEEVIESIDYIKKQSTFLSINDLKIQINTSSPLNNIYKNILNVLRKKRHIIHRVDDNIGVIVSNKKLIILGTNLLVNFFPRTEYTPINIKNSANFLLFHEFSHSLEKTNPKQYGTIISDSFNYMLLKLQILKDDLLKESKKLPKLRDELSNIETLKREIYADVSAILNMRNYQIIKNEYHHESFLSFIDTLINLRNSHYLKEKDFKNNTVIKSNKENVQYINILTSMHHLTSNSLESLKEEMQTNDLSKVYSESEIHNIAEKSSIQQISRILYALMKYNKELESQINIISSLHEIIPDLSHISLERYFQEFGKEIILDKKINYTSLLKQEIEKHCEQKWIIEFNNQMSNLNKIEQLDIVSLSFLFATSKKLFEQEINCFYKFYNSSSGFKNNLISIREKIQKNNEPITQIKDKKII